MAKKTATITAETTSTDITAESEWRPVAIREWHKANSAEAKLDRIATVVQKSKKTGYHPRSGSGGVISLGMAIERILDGRKVRI